MRIKGIASDTLIFILEICKSTAPDEFAGLLQEKDGIITEVLILPGTESSEQNAVIKLFMMPNVKAVGSIHSHPGPNREPSQADLHMFSKTGNCHIIVGYSYDIQSWTCYDKEGNVRDLQVIDEKFEDFEEANLDGADFEGANLEGADFKKATLEEADLERTDFVGANLEGTDLIGANLAGADLQEANLKRANLRLANLKEANLKGADFEGANLKKVLNLSIEQLSEAKTLYNAKLDDVLLIPLKEKYPTLFEKPEN
ncbi:MAG: pentapeptide repeat-containing protein [Methanococcaceae archaeon]